MSSYNLPNKPIGLKTRDKTQWAKTLENLVVASKTKRFNRLHKAKYIYVYIIIIIIIIVIIPSLVERDVSIKQDNLNIFLE